MPPSPATPDWSLVDVRERAAAWRDGHTRVHVALALAVGVVVLLVANAAAGSAGGSGNVARTAIGLLVGAAVGASAGVAVGHVTAAGPRYPQHLLAAPALFGAVTRPVGPSEALAAALVAIVVGVGVPPLAGLAIGLGLIALVPTGPGVAIAAALDRASDAIAEEAGASPTGGRAVGSVLLLGGVGATFLATLRTLWTSAPDCGLNWVGVACGADTAGALALGAGVAAWFALPTGAAVSASLDVALDLGTDAASPIATAALDAGHVDDLIDLLHDRFDELSPAVRERVVVLVASSLDGEAAIDGSDDVLERLETAIRSAGAERTLEVIATLHDRADTIDRLRSQYDRTPKLARGALERTASTAVRATGVPRDVAEPAVQTLLTMPADDWRTVTDTLDEVVQRFTSRTEASPA